MAVVSEGEDFTNAPSQAEIGHSSESSYLMVRANRSPASIIPDSSDTSTNDRLVVW
jgi:hypothetical protein